VVPAEAELPALDDAPPLLDPPDEHPASIGTAATSAAPAFQPEAQPPAFPRPISASPSCPVDSGRLEEVSGRTQDLRRARGALGSSCLRNFCTPSPGEHKGDGVRYVVTVGGVNPL
jgi:hypothetical protein